MILCFYARLKILPVQVPYTSGNYKDSKLEILSKKGNGNFAYLDNINEAEKVLVITSNTSCLPEISGGAALYADPINADAIATQMLQLYKDESLRNKLIEAGVLQARRYSWDKTADLFWQTITELAGN